MDQIRRAEKLAADNSPVILTAIGVAGTVTTAILTGKAGYKTALALSEESPHISKREILEKVWTFYLPPITTGAVTIASIIAANRIGTSRAAALAAAYTLSEKAFVEYKDKVVEKLGEKREQTVRDEVAQDRINANPVSASTVVVTGNGNVLCFESYTGRYFYSDMESIKAAQNNLNYMLNSHQYASLSDLCDFLGLERTKLTDEVGWNIDNLLEIQFSTCLSDTGAPAISLDFLTRPKTRYDKVY